MANRKKEIFAVLFVILFLSSFAFVSAVDEEDEEAKELAKAGAVSLSKAMKLWFSSVKEGDTGVPIYDDHKTLIDFMIFFVIFLSLSVISLGKFLAKGGNKNAVIGLSLALSAALALAAIKAGMSVTFFIPFVKNAMFFIMFLLIFLLFRKLGMTSIFWNVILSFILTFLLFNIGNIILDKDAQFNLGNLFGAPALSESLAQAKSELTKTNDRFSALQKAINESDIYKDFKGDDQQIQFEELIEAKKHYNQKLEEAEAAEKEADVKRYEEILEVVNDHIERWEGHESDKKQLTNYLASKGYVISDSVADVLKQADEIIKKAKEHLENIQEGIKEAEAVTDTEEREEKFEAIEIITGQTRNRIQQARDILSERIEAPETTPEQKREIDKRMIEIEQLAKEINILGDEIVENLLNQAAAKAEEGDKAVEIDKKIELYEEAVVLANQAFDLADGIPDLRDDATKAEEKYKARLEELRKEKEKPPEVKVIEVDIDKRPEPGAGIRDIKEYLEHLKKAEESAR